LFYNSIKHLKQPLMMENSKNSDQEHISLLKTKPSLDMIWQAAESYTNKLKLTGSVYSTTLKINNVDTDVYITLITDTIGVIEIYNNDFDHDSNDDPKFSSKYVGGIDNANNKIMLFDEPLYYGELKLAEEKVLSIFK
jgi:hypothetical protein